MGIAHSTGKSFLYAFRGIKTALSREPNLKIHSVIGILVSVLAYFLGFSTIEWLILIITIFLVLIFELINTVLEAIVNLVSPEIREEARVAKDVSAAAVLLSAIFAIIVGIVLFLPKIF